MRQARQAELFDAPASADLTLSQQLTRAPKPANKQQAKLQRLLKDIAKQQQLLQEWQAFQPQYQASFLGEFEPLHTACRNMERDIVLALDQALKSKGVLRGKVQQADAIDTLLEMARGLLAGEDDAALLAVHDEYSDQTYADYRQEQLEMERHLLALYFGDEPEDYAPRRAAAPSAPEQAAADAEAVAAETASAQTAGQPHAGAEMPPHADSGGQARRPSKRQLAQEALARDASQTVRQVFRSLASKLHPDRESDPAERERKTSLMQRANQAYAAQDLLELLSLQYECEQLDLGHLEQLDSQRLNQYLYLFGEQLKALQQEVEELAEPFRAMMRNQRANFRPQTVSKALANDLTALKKKRQILEETLAACQEPERLKRWLKANRTRYDW